MPYKTAGKRILKKKNGRWVFHAQAESEEAARKQVAALNIEYVKNRRGHKLNVRSKRRR